MNHALTTPTKTKAPNYTRRAQPASYHSWRSGVLKFYADRRVGATRAEKLAHRSADSIMLSFDDYGSRAQINQLLSVLKQANVRAMFFLRGDWAERHLALVRQIEQAGHIIGNHSYSHRDLLSLSDDEVRTEIRRGLISPWLRPPMGRYNNRIRRLASELGMKICYWSIDSDDWQGVSAQYMRAKIAHELHPGAVVLFHLHADTTLTAMAELIADIRARGYELEPLT